MGWLNDPQIWASLLTLTALEIVLGIDNLVFITILAGRLPAERQNRARRMGLGLALITRLALLASIAWIIGLTQPVFEILDRSISWRDLILIGGGFFLQTEAGGEPGSRLFRWIVSRKQNVAFVPEPTSLPCCQLPFVSGARSS